MKVGIVGAGAVGSSCLLALVMRGSAREIVLVNRNRKRAKGVVTDVQYGAVLSPTVELRSGDYSDLAGASLVMITAGVNEKSSTESVWSVTGLPRWCFAMSGVPCPLVPTMRSMALPYRCRALSGGTV